MKRFSITLLCTLGLSACGGDSGDDSTSEPVTFSIAEKIENRPTVPVFFPWPDTRAQEAGMPECNQAEDLWFDCDTENTPYSLVWHSEGIAKDMEDTGNTASQAVIDQMKTDPDTLYLISEDWHYYYPEHRNLDENSVHYSGVVFEPHKGSEYGQTLLINFDLKSWADLLAEKSQNYLASGYDGIMFDWWNDDADGIWDENDPNDFRTREEIKKARLQIAKTIREKVGKDFIILANVNDNEPDEVAPYMSGVFMELYKEPEHQYTTEEIGDFVKLVQAWDEKLAYPKVISLNPWKITPAGVDFVDARAQEPNPTLAQMFSAIAMVIPENGHIMYGDNNGDWDGGDHQHLYYDSYKTDLGKAIDKAKFTVIAADSNDVPFAAYKEFEKGYAVFNRSDLESYTFVLNDQQHTILPMAGLYIKK